MGLKEQDEQVRLELLKRGVSVENDGHPYVQRYNRLMDLKRHEREHRLWIIALISALSSVISSIAAWVAVCYK